MKKIIFILVAVVAIGCNKSKVRTCTIKSYDGKTYTVITDKPMTRNEMNAYEKELVGSYTPNNTPGGEAKVCCK